LRNSTSPSRARVRSSARFFRSRIPRRPGSPPS
jgi:hypothetical protein